MSLQGFCPFPQDAETSKMIIFTWLEGISEVARRELYFLLVLQLKVSQRGDLLVRYPGTASPQIR